MKQMIKEFLAALKAKIKEFLTVEMCGALFIVFVILCTIAAMLSATVFHGGKYERAALVVAVAFAAAALGVVPNVLFEFLKGNRE